METVQRKRIKLIDVRLWVMIALTAVPVALYIVFGAYALWKTDLLIWLWWILPLGWALSFLLAKLWPAQPKTDARAPAAKHWTPRDQEAAEIVLRYQQRVDALTPAQLTSAQFYIDQFQELSNELATYYHPDASDPFSSLTVPELAAAVRLVADDWEQIVLNSLPGSRLLTVNQWRSFGNTPKWANRIRNSIWAGSILINPLNIARYGVSRCTIDKVSSGIQSELLATIYLRLIRQVGFYLIEMNSGRLRGGADAYRDSFEATQRSIEKIRASKSNTVTIGLIGQVSSGKSSLVNCIVSGAEAAVDILPETKRIKRYSLPIEQSNTQRDSQSNTQRETNFVLLDSPGYGESGASASQLAEIETALSESDMILLAVDAHSPARAADVETLKKISDRLAKAPNLKPPPIIAVLTHIDLLPPARQWSPPYDLENPKTPKADNIAQAIDYAKEVFGSSIVGAVAVCSAEDPSRRWGVTEQLMPLLLSQLDEGKSVAILQAFEQAIDEGWGENVWDQLKTAGKGVAKMWLQEKINRMGKK